MPKITNRSKYNTIWADIDARTNAVIASMFPDGIPEKMYCFRNYEAGERKITKVDRYHQGIYEKGSDERISEADIEKAAEYAKRYEPGGRENFFAHYIEERDGYKISGAEKLIDVDKGVIYAWTAEALQPEIERRKALYAPREGHAPCNYCQTQRLPSDLKEATILYRSQGGLARKVGKYCHDKPCASHDQMGHEG